MYRQWLTDNRSLNSIEKAAGLATQTLISLATNNQLFLSSKVHLCVKRLSIKELQQLIVGVRDLLHTLTFPPHCSAPTHPSTHAVEHALDPIHAANLEHLLLCLQSLLLRQLIHLCIELLHDHIAECQKTRKRSRDDWFFEFPDARPPLSTTWPWAIKPSLAVLWGVCWMFFGPIYWDKEGNLIDPQGNIQVSRRELDQLLSDPVFMNGNGPQQTPQRGIASPYNNTYQMSSAGGILYQQHQIAGAYPHYSAPAQPRLRNGSHLPPDSATTMIMATAQPQHARPRPLDTQPRHTSSRAHSAYGESRASRFCLSNREADIKAAEQNQAPASGLAQAQAGTNTAYRAQCSANFLPEDNTTFAYFDQQQQEIQGLWWQEPDNTSQRRRQYLQPAHPRRNSSNLAVQTQGLPPRPRSTSQVTPTITVTTERQPYTPDSQAQPQDTSHHTSATSQNAPYTYGSTAYIDHNGLYADPNFGMADVQIQGPPPPVGQMGIASPISDNQVLSRPISPSNAPPMGDPNMRKRSFSEMSQPQQQQQAPPPAQMQMLPAEHQSPQPSPYETSPGGMEDAGHKVQRMIKRGDPPQAHDGKYYCNFAPECADQYFDRKCEWR